MNRKKVTVLLTMVLLISSVFSTGADLDPDKAFDLLMNWEKPKNYPPPMLDGMDLDTLAVMLDSGNLQWYEPRPEEKKWEAVVGMKVHAPADVLWDVMVDYKLQCEIMKDTFDYCEEVERNGNEIKNIYKIHTSVILYTFHMDMVEIAREDPPHHLHLTTIEGELKGKELDIILIPVDGGKNTLIFTRYFGPMAAIGASMRMVLAVLPQVEPPTNVSAANYHTRAYKMEAEKRVGYKGPQKPKDLDVDKLDVKTLRIINKGNGGLIRESPEGEFIDALTFTFIDAPVERVWEVSTDFENYEEIFDGSKSEIESIDGNTVVLNQETTGFKILFFKFGQTLKAQYKLDPPGHFSFTSIEGVHKGTYGDFRLLPVDGGDGTLVFGVAGINLDNDDGLVAKVTQSGAFPLEIMLNMITVQFSLSSIKQEAEKRENSK